MSDLPLAPIGGQQDPEPSVPTAPTDVTKHVPHPVPVTTQDPDEKWRPAMPEATSPSGPTPHRQVRPPPPGATPAFVPIPSQETSE